MFWIEKNKGEMYWNSYRLLENQLIRLSHSICFDDDQIDVYSTELADIINSACIKIESLAKDIYEEHICQFQLDQGIIPVSFLEDKDKRASSDFKPEKWTRKKWKYDFNCLVEIDLKYALSKKRLHLKQGRFHFLKYGTTLLPFSNIALNKCKGGVWTYCERDNFGMHNTQLKRVDWCESYQCIKHNYLESIPKHGTIKNAIMVLAAFYLLAIYYSCLPQKRFDYDEKYDKDNIDFGSELFYCGQCNYTLPPFVIDSGYIAYEQQRKASYETSPIKEILMQQDYLNDIEGIPFYTILSKDAYEKVKTMVTEYCKANSVDVFDIAPYEREHGLDNLTPGAMLYKAIQKYIRAPYYRQNICIAFNTGADSVYVEYPDFADDYEKSKYAIRTKKVLESLEVGDVVDAKFAMDTKITNGRVVKFNEHTIDVSVKGKTLSEPIGNIIYIRIRKKKA